MQKNAKRIISATLAINALSAIIPASSSNLMMTEVQAASEYGITNLKLCKTSGSKTITLYEDSDYDDSVKFKKSKTKYYAKTDSSSVNVRVTEEDGYETKIFKTSSSSADAFDPEEKISIKSGTTTLYVRTYKDGEFDEDNVKDNVVKEYKVYVKKVSSLDEDDDDDDYDDIYLDDLTLTYKDDDIDFDFEEDKSTYNIEVKNSVIYVKVCAEPEDEDYSVRINGSTVNEDDDWEKKVNLEEGKNTITVKIKYDGDERVYTLNITRKASSSSSNTDNDNSNNTTDSNNGTSTVKANQWVTVNGKWQYNDASGNPIKNTWFYDRGYGQTYYLDAQGNMVTGWLYKDSQWYYLDNSGAKRTGWQLVGGEWYYLDSAGVMKTGWLKDLDGKWYYLKESGKMARNETINGYKLGSNGAWIK
ncbi:N-acetylmuramoyl-L-alanine amidase family protein [Clostridium neonatale]|uniref:N-acetylmuramoyl-L-alanine amidase family protein n=1 Tax=Clostridium neonatale TaxID=137838 RepID=UPI00291B8DD0|nr:Conserved hypothetical protein, Cell wall binding repeats [Clostridium neonatale]CAI3670172.1 Conserved hypothetical protein, Cell wall binding repeats [Clostridium neonatale]CAI3670896.1 Conserved hypothetical protein, Cell wall binding repeats [Clostridium neonatale]CAI3687048.1 Conserved hypothetical protein, Cell wall binding repeats [Clostridium neonatale]CAI3716910.1 Conserved hypothetical protein, Cell wall binding repeats [Clostridium neonatale]